MPFSFPYFVSSLGSISERAEKHFFLEMCYTATVQVHKKKNAQYFRRKGYFIESALLS